MHAEVIERSRTQGLFGNGIYSTRSTRLKRDARRVESGGMDVDGPSRSRRPVSAQAANRNLGLLSLATAVYMTLSGFSRVDGPGASSRQMGTAVDFSAAATLLVVGVFLLRNARMIGRTPREVWVARTNAQRRQYLPWLYMSAALLSVLTAAALISHHKVLVGVLLAPVGLLDLLAVGNLSGGIRPLRDNGDYTTQ